MEIEEKFNATISENYSDRLDKIEAKIGYVRGVQDKISLEQGLLNQKFGAQYKMSNQDLQKLITFSEDTQAMRLKTEQELNNIQDRIISNMLSMEAYEQR